MSDWTVPPQHATWYGECIFGGKDWTDYNYGYSNDPDPDPRELAIEGSEILEFTRHLIGDRSDAGDLSF